MVLNADADQLDPSRRRWKCSTWQRTQETRRLVWEMLSEVEWSVLKMLQNVFTTTSNEFKSNVTNIKFEAELEEGKSSSYKKKKAINVSKGIREKQTCSSGANM